MTTATAQPAYEKLELDGRQITRLRNMHKYYEQKEDRLDFLTIIKCSPMSMDRLRESNRRAAIHWFLRGDIFYHAEDDRHKSEVLAHLHNYIESGGAKYLQHAEQSWKGTMTVNHEHGIESEFDYWVEGQPRRLRLLTKRIA